MENKGFILVALAIILMTLAAVSAEDNVTEDIAVIDNQSQDEVILANANVQNEKSEGPHAGYWVLSRDRDNLDLDNLSKQGVTDIFLNFKSYEVYEKDNLESWITNASDKGISTHIWTQIFWTSATGWELPIENGTQNTEFFTQKIDELNRYAQLKGLAGIHMDYLRYSGSADSSDEGKKAITEFVRMATSSIRQTNPNLTISAALMPNLKSLQNKYGVDYPVISSYFDVIVPMVYSGNFKKDRDWIISTTKEFIANSGGAKIWTGLQSYVSDTDLTHLSLNQMNADISAALYAGATGVVVFRYGVSENVNFNDAFKLKFSINAKSSSFIITKGGNYHVELKDSKGNPIPGEKVTFILNKKKIGYVLTDSKGIAKIRITPAMLKSAGAGKKTLKVKLSNGNSKTVKITVKKDTAKLKVSKNKKNLHITLKGYKAKAIKKAKITIKIKSKKYKIKTNAKGKATFRIPKKSAKKAKVTFAGNKYYKKISKIVKVR
jgi:hypothetical protein